MKRLPVVLAVAVLVCGYAACGAAAEPVDSQALAAEILATAEVPGGLCVHLGCGDGALTAALVADGRFLVHGLAPDAATADAAARLIRSRGLYGQACVEAYPGKHLPYAENLVNLLVADDFAQADVPLAEIMRVLVPGGVAFIGQGEKAANTSKKLDAAGLKQRLADAGITGARVIERHGVWACFSKPRPPEMDDWGHPRHGPDGNAVSNDTLVGPPRRIRWVAGPMHEVSNIVTAGGRFFYAGLIARDAFNGLRLWDAKLDPTPVRLGFLATAMRGSVLPVAVGKRVYVVTEGKLQALDAATGKVVQTYADAATPLEILWIGGTLVTCDEGSARALNAETGKLLWSHAAAKPLGVVAGDGGVYFIGAQGKGIAKLDLASGKPLWQQTSYAWGPKVRRLSYHNGRVVCEVSTLADARPDNGIHVLDARDGRQVWERVYEPGQNHWQQGRALQTDSRLWILTNGLWEGLDPLTGSLVQSFKAGANHCFPPLATTRFLVGSEMGFTDMVTGVVDANRITKQACSRDAGVILANGLVYAAPKHCSCYPMLKSYSALAPAKPSPGPAAKAPEPADFVAERGPAYGEPAPASAAASSAAEWPCYRADAWRSASAASAPAGLDVLWTAELGDWPAGPRVQDWKENVYARGPVTPPVVAGGMAFVAQPDGHRVVAFDAGTGKVRWDFTANGRIDTPPTINGGLCLFGTRSGTVYALRAADGKLAWRLRAGPDDERIISFGQLESPWPVPGSVLVVGDTAYFAAGRHPLADGGIRLFAVDPARGTVKWVKTLVSLPMKDYYGGAALEFDPFDLLVAEEKRPVAGGATGAADGRPDFITMSRWQIDPATGDMGVAWESGFGYYRTGPGAGGVMAARSVWTYGQRMDYLASGAKPGVPDTVGAKLRPLAAFRGSTLAASTDDGRRLFLREFTPESAAAFNDKWYSQRQLPKKKDAPGDRDRHERLSHEAKWTVDVFDAAERDQRIAAVVLAGDTVYVAGTKGRLLAFAAADGRKLAQCDLSAALWDGVAAAYGHLFISTQSGGLVCLGKK